jgi:Fe-S cluster assembly protein SufD
MSAVETFVQQFGAAREALPGRGLPWLERKRAQGIAKLSDLGLPGPQLEDWKYTSLRALDKADFRFLPHEFGPAKIDRVPSLLPSVTSCHRLVFVDGHFNAGLSSIEALPEGVVLDTLSAVLASNPDLLEPHLLAGDDDDGAALLALNSAMMAEGFVLHLAAGVNLLAPVEIVQLSNAPAAGGPLAYHPRNLILLEAGAQATLLEHHSGLGEAANFTNIATNVVLGEAALLRHYKLQNEDLGAIHLSNLRARVGKTASYDAFTLSIGAQLSRNEALVRLEGEGASCHLNGAYLMRGKQHCDNTTQIDHLVPETSCREIFKGVLDDEARAVFQGRIVVHKDAQKTNGHQLSKVLLLSDRAEIDTKPELEIYADDVLCSHGATVGDLDHDALFYMRSRGIPEPQARAMLIEAFLAEAINAIAAEGLCPALMTSVGHWLADR